MLQGLGVIVLLVSFVCYGVAVYNQSPAKADILELLKLLLSWKVLATGAAVWAAKTFEAEIKSRLTK